LEELLRGTVFSHSVSEETQSCCFPAMYQLSGGRIFASFKAAPEKGPKNKGECTLLSISEDGGKNWSNAAKIFSPPIIDGKKTTLRTLYFIEDKDSLIAVCNAVDATMEDLPYYNEETEGLKDTYIIISHSSDKGESWSEFKRIQVNSFYDLPLPLTGAPFKTKDGKIGIQFEVNKPYYEEKYWMHHSAVIYSEDGGKTWGNEVIITDNPDIYYWDQRISVLEDGTVTDAFWTFDRTIGDYINIHMCKSEDNGKSFGNMINTGLCGQPGNIIDGKDGSLLMIYINRDAAPVIRIAEKKKNSDIWEDIFTVYDRGQEIEKKKNAGMNDVWNEMGAFFVGHPFLCSLSDGSIMAYFYSGESTHKTDFCFVKLII